VTSKRERLAAWLCGEGIEIGALHQPLSVPEGARVRYVDRLEEAELRKHYPELGGQAFAPVTILGDAENLSAIPDESVDFVVANHLLEHLEDPVRGLKEFQRVLKRDGVLYMALPDSRVTFDRARKLTAVEHLLEDHRRGPARSRREHFLDWVINVENVLRAEKLNGRACQEGPSQAGGVSQGDEDRVALLMSMNYSIHFHVWQPETFLEFFMAAKREFSLDFEIAVMESPESSTDIEFIMILLKGRAVTPRYPRAPIRTSSVPAAPAGLRTRLARSRIGRVLVSMKRVFGPAAP
jgi:SAM-dependent methyltransferase